MSLPQAVPAQCTPTTSFLLWLSDKLDTCVPTPLAAISSALGTLSILSWLFAQMPQIYKNYQIQSTAGLSIFFLSEWLLGDLTNLLGALFTNQATWQVIIASYYTFVDICLVVQFFWYTHIKPRWRGASLHSGGSRSSEDNDSDMINSLSPINTEFSDGPLARTEMLQSRKGRDESHMSDKKPKLDLRDAPQFQAVDYSAPATPIPEQKIQGNGWDWTSMASPKTLLTGVVASMATPARGAPIPVLIALRASMPVHSHQASSSIELAGTILSWCSTLLYLGSRLPQLYKNWSRKSTAGLSPLLFFAAFCGNFFYSMSILTNPNAWNDFEPYGGHGWADEKGSDRVDWILRATPFFLGAAGVLVMDGLMGVQFLLYGEREEELVRVRDSRGFSHWERVNGWMRGWIPNIGSKAKVVDLAESQRLLAESREIERFHRGYDAVSTW